MTSTIVYFTPALLLARTFLRDHMIRLVWFTREYGKVTTWAKKEKGLPDIGTLGKLSIDRQKDINIFSGFELLQTVSTHTWSYIHYVTYMRFLAHIYTLLPDHDLYPKLFDDIIDMTHALLHTSDIHRALILMDLRLMKLLGYLRQESLNFHPSYRYLYTYIDQIPIQTILTSKRLHLLDINVLERSILNSIPSYI